MAIEHGAVIEFPADLRAAEMEAAGPPLGFVQAFARRVPSMTICGVLGVPHSDASVTW